MKVFIIYPMVNAPLLKFFHKSYAFNIFRAIKILFDQQKSLYGSVLLNANPSLPRKILRGQLQNFFIGNIGMRNGFVNLVFCILLEV